MWKLTNFCLNFTFKKKKNQFSGCFLSYKTHAPISYSRYSSKITGWKLIGPYLFISYFACNDITLTDLANFCFTPLFWHPQGPQGCLEKQNHPLSSNLVVWCASIWKKIKNRQVAPPSKKQLKYFSNTNNSTILTLPGPPGVSREAKLSIEFEFGTLVRYIWAQNWERGKIREKIWWANHKIPNSELQTPMLHCWSCKQQPALLLCIVGL